MSLIVETLKKLRKRENKPNENNIEVLPPGIGAEKKEEKFKISRKVVLFSLLGISFVGAFVMLGFAYYINSMYGKITIVSNSSNITKLSKAQLTNNNYPEKTANNKEIPKPEEISQNTNKEQYDTQEHNVAKNETTSIEEKIEKHPQKLQEKITNNQLKEPPSIEITKKEAFHKLERNKELNVEKKEVGVNIRQPTNNTHKIENINKLILLADYYLDKGELLEAQKLYEKAFKLKKDNYVLEKLAFIYIQTGQIEKLNKLSEFIKNNQNLSKKISIKLIKLGYLDFAKNFIRINILNIADRNLLIGMLYEKSGNIDNALIAYEEAFKFNKQPIYAYSYGRILEIKGEYKKALEVYKKAKNNNDKFYKIIKERIKFLEGL